MEEPVGLLRGQAGLKELGIWCRKGSLWRRHLQLADGRYASIVEDYSASDTDGAWILWSGSLVLARCVEAQFDADAAEQALAASREVRGRGGGVALSSSRCCRGVVVVALLLWRTGRRRPAPALPQATQTRLGLETTYTRAARAREEESAAAATSNAFGKASLGKSALAQTASFR